MAKYIVWGTGMQARNVMETYMSVLGKDILYFTDSAVNKWGTLFYGKEICPPSKILEGGFDKILICCGAEGAVRSQLICNFRIKEEQIIYEETIRNEIYNYYVKEDIRNKRIIVVGDKKLYWGMRGRYQSIFNNIVGALSIAELAEIDKYEFDYVVLTNLMMQEIEGIKRTQGRVRVEANIIKLLVENYGISAKRILTNGLYKAIAAFPYYVSWGEEQADKTFAVIRVSGETGLGAWMLQVNAACAVAKNLGYIPVVDASREFNPYLNESDYGKVNAWELFFMQPADYSLEDIKGAKNIWIFPEEYNGNGAVLSKKEMCDFIRPKPKMEKMAKKYLEEVVGEDKRILAVVYRGTDYRKLEPYGHPIQPTLEQYFETIEQKEREWGKFDKIFLSTESLTGIEAFKEKFGDKLCYISRVRLRDNVTGVTPQEFRKVDDPINNAYFYYSDMYVASKCNSFIYSCCCSSGVIITMNQDNYENTHMFELGTYGM